MPNTAKERSALSRAAEILAPLTSEKLFDGSAPHTLAHGRNNVDSYTVYYRGMDQSEAQKVALSTAHIPTGNAIIIDMGFGTGKTSYHLARLYPSNFVIGVDIDPHALQHASMNYREANLQFIQGDITELNLPEGQADVIFSSANNHEILSYASVDRFDLRHLEKLFDKHVAMLGIGGKYIIRDFVLAAGPEQVLLDLPNNDGGASGAPKELSTVGLFRDFLARFRCHDFPEGGAERVVFERGEIAPGWTRFMIPQRLAHEFVLRRHYTERWNEELKEEYTYLSQGAYEEAFSKRGLRVIVAQEIHNPWIEEHWFRGKFKISDLAGNPLPFPPTNFLIVGEKVGPGEGVRIQEQRWEKIDRPRFLSLRRYERKEMSPDATPGAMEVVTRPNPAICFIPYYIDANGNVSVVVKQGSPRPLLNCTNGGASLDRSSTGGYAVEAISTTCSDTSKATLTQAVATHTGIAAETFTPDSLHDRYFPSPGTSDEEVRTCYVRLGKKPEVTAPLVNTTGLGTAGVVSAIDSVQALRAFQVGGMHDARLEIDLYRLHIDRRLSCGAWIGAGLSIRDQRHDLTLRDPASLLTARREAYETTAAPGAGSFFQLFRGTFEESRADGAPVGAVDLEYVVPKRFSAKTASIIPYARVNGEIVVWLEERDFPSVQIATGSSALATIPAFRIDRHTRDLSAVPGEVQAKCYAEFGLTLSDPKPLGGKYFPSIGFSPETAYTFAAEVDLSASVPPNSRSVLHPVSLKELLNHQSLIRDGHLLTSLFRLSHALSLL